MNNNKQIHFETGLIKWIELHISEVFFDLQFIIL